MLPGATHGDDGPARHLSPERRACAVRRPIRHIPDIEWPLVRAGLGNECIPAREAPNAVVDAPLWAIGILAAPGLATRRYIVGRAVGKDGRECQGYGEEKRVHRTLV